MNEVSGYLNAPKENHSIARMPKPKKDFTEHKHTLQ